MAKLGVKEKRFIVQALACWDTPTQVAAAVKEHFGLVLTRQQVAYYDPTTTMGVDVSKELRKLFHETRERFRSEIDDIPIANQAFRLRSLSKMHEEARGQGNKPLAAQLLEQVAKEVGGAYTNTRRHEGGDPSKPITHEHRHAMTDAELESIAAGGLPKP